MAARDSDEEMKTPDWEAVVKPLCESKAEEFRFLGYDQVEGKDIWECVSDKYRKHGTPALHQVVSDILSLRATQYMNFITMRIYRGELR